MCLKFCSQISEGVVSCEHWKSEIKCFRKIINANLHVFSDWTLFPISNDRLAICALDNF